MRVLTPLVFLLILGGCTQTRTVVRYKPIDVLVPVPLPPLPPPEIERPELPVSQLDSVANSADVVRAYAASLLLLKGYAIELERLLDAYRYSPNQTRQIRRLIAQ